MKVTLLIVLLTALVAAAMAGAPGVNTGKGWKSSYQQMRKKHSSLKQVDRIILQVIREMTNQQTSLRNAITNALRARNLSHNRRVSQRKVVNTLRTRRVSAEGRYNAARTAEQRAINTLKVREKIHRANIKVYRKTHYTNTRAISHLDREKRILTEIRRLLGGNRASKFVGHRDHRHINRANAHKFKNYRDQRSSFHHGKQRFNGHWSKLSHVSTETKTAIGVNLKGINSNTKKVKFVNQGTILDWYKNNKKTWTSYGFDLAKLVFKVLDKKTKKVLYVALAEPYHKCGLDKLDKSRTDFKVMPELLIKKDGPVATCYRANNKVNNCFNQIVLDTTRYQPVGVLDIESLGKCWTKDNALRFRFAVLGFH